MKNILCYGDSNTWGWNPATLQRFSITERWTGVLRQTLGEGYTVYDEALNGRTTVWDDPLQPHRNGKTHLPMCLLSHKPLDLVIILLGTNDLKSRQGVSAHDIAEGAGVLVDIVQRSRASYDDTAPQVLLMAPPPIIPSANTDAASKAAFEAVWASGIEKSQQFAAQYQRIADWYDCAFFDTATIVESSELDGIHWEAPSHAALGRAVAEQVTQLLTDSE